MILGVSFSGSGANFIKCMFLSGERLCGFQAAMTAAQISGAAAASPVSSVRVELLFLDFLCQLECPEIVTAAVSNRLNPSIGRTRCFIRR